MNWFLISTLFFAIFTSFCVVEAERKYLTQSIRLTCSIRHDKRGNNILSALKAHREKHAEVCRPKTYKHHGKHTEQLIEVVISASFETTIVEVHTKTETLATSKKRIHSTSTRHSTTKSPHATTNRHRTIRTQIHSRTLSVSVNSVSVSATSTFSIPSFQSLPTSQTSAPTGALSLPVSSILSFCNTCPLVSSLPPSVSPFTSFSLSVPPASSIQPVLSLPTSQKSVFPSTIPTSTLSLGVSSTVPSSCLSVSSGGPGFYLYSIGKECTTASPLAFRNYSPPDQPFDFPQSCISDCLAIVGCVSIQINQFLGFACYL